MESLEAARVLFLTYLYLLIPTSGEIIIDDYVTTDENILDNWQSQIAHVPQNIYLLNGTIAENIALEVSPEKIDNNLLKNQQRLLKYMISLAIKRKALIFR